MVAEKPFERDFHPVVFALAFVDQIKVPEIKVFHDGGKITGVIVLYGQVVEMLVVGLHFCKIMVDAFHVAVLAVARVDGTCWIDFPVQREAGMKLSTSHRSLAKPTVEYR